MATKRRKKGGKAKSKPKSKAKPRPSGSPLTAHKRHKKELIPPLMQQPVAPVDWCRDALPDLLWVAAVSDALGDVASCHGPLDVLDEFVDGKGYLDGRISQFSIVVLEKRASAREALREHFPHAMPAALSHALLCYANCPIDWLLDAPDHADPAIGLPYLKRIVSRILDDHRGVWATRLRMIPIARMIKHGRLAMGTQVQTAELLGRYPIGLSTEQQRQVESFTRATYSATTAMFGDAAAKAWTEHFWRQGWRISECEPWVPGADGFDPVPSHGDGDGDGDRDDENGITPPAVAPTSGAGRSLGMVASENDPDLQLRAPDFERMEKLRDAAVSALDCLSFDLEGLQKRVPFDLYDPTSDEIRLGLAARQLRLFRTFVEDMRLWCFDLTAAVLRPAAESRILTAWLLQRDDPELYARFKSYGKGKQKLFKLHLEAWMTKNPSSDADDDELRRTQAEVNAETIEEFTGIDLGAVFPKTDLRKMAEETGLKALYDLMYQRASSDFHAEWTSLIRFDFQRCGNPLHRRHWLGAFTPNPVALDPSLVKTLFRLTRELVCAVFDHYEIDARPAFATFAQSVTHALGEDQPAA